MDFDGAVRTRGKQVFRNWRTEPRKRRKFDPFYFQAIFHRIKEIDDLAQRTQLFLDREARMAEGF